MHRLGRRLKRNQQGITGLETAIILIAFIIVASVFAYVVLSAGLFSAQKAKEAVHAGLEETRSTVELKGNVLGKGSSPHAAAVVGDTVGDPFKDTAGPSLHVLVKLLATITLVMCPLFI